MKTLLLFFFFFTLSVIASSQNCGQVLAFRGTVDDNGDLTSDYTFEVDIQATNGGSKSVNVTISCPNNTFVENSCHESQSTTLTVIFGPFTTPTCTGPIILDWTGYTNATCGGTTCAGQSLSLPVELSSFETSMQDDQVILHWETETEINNNGFEIQKSANGRDWEKLSWIPGAGTTFERQEYLFVDKNPFIGNNYYRLKQIDFNGQFEFSTIKSAQFQSDLKFIKVYPNPTKGLLTLKGIDVEYGHLKIMDLMGRIVLNIKNPEPSIDLSSLPKGLYYLSIEVDHHVLLERIVKE